MKTLYVFCEGLTEQNFCNQVLAPHLYGHGFTHIPTIRVAFARHHGEVIRGGLRTFATLKTDIVNKLKERRDRDVWFTTMIDLFRLPRDFPGKSAHVRNPADPRPYAEALEAEFAAQIGDFRFIPHLQLHEYEALLYADPDAFQIAFDECERAIESLKRVVAAVPSPEHINDTPEGAPSKRIIDMLPAYEGRKAIAGPEIAEYIGLDVLRSKCPHFSDWVSRLETLGA